MCLPADVAQIDKWFTSKYLLLSKEKQYIRSSNFLKVILVIKIISLLIGGLFGLMTIYSIMQNNCDKSKI